MKQLRLPINYTKGYWICQSLQDSTVFLSRCISGNMGGPHFHALYGEFNGVYEIESLEILEGDLPNRAHTMVQEWAGVYRDDLLNMWETQSFKKLPGLE